MKKKTEALTGPMATIADTATRLASHRTTLESLHAEIQREQLAVALKYRPQLRNAQGLLLSLKNDLLKLVQGAREFFVRPKSQVFDGIAVGYEKARGKQSWPDDALLVQRIRKLLPEKADLLIHQPPETVRREAIKGLTATEKQTLGIVTMSGADEAFVRLEKSDVEAQTEALLTAFENAAPAPKQEAA